MIKLTDKMYEILNFLYVDAQHTWTVEDIKKSISGIIQLKPLVKRGFVHQVIQMGEVRYVTTINGQRYMEGKKLLCLK